MLSDKTTIKNMPEAERPRERLLKYSASKLSNAELLAILLSTGSVDLSAIGLAQRILRHREDGIRFLTDCSVEELCEIKGVGLAKASQLIASVELGKRIALAAKANNDRIKTPEDVSRMLMEEMRYLTKEHFNVLLLNTKHEVIANENISIGTLSASLVHPREVFVRAIKRSASSVILVHNHPSGDPLPSKEDIQITKRLQEAGQLLGISVLDHIIFGDGVYVSLKEKDLM